MKINIRNKKIEDAILSQKSKILSGAKKIYASGIENSKTLNSAGRILLDLLS